MNKVILFVFLSFIFASFAWNTADTNRAIESINSKQLKTGLWDSLYETYAAIQTLDMLGAKTFNNKENICKALNEQFLKVQKASENFYFLATYKKLKCGSDVPSQITENVKQLLKKPDELSTEELRYLVGNIPLIGADKLGNSTLGGLVEIITDRMEDRGIFRSFKDVEDASVLNAGHAFRALAQLYRLKVSNKEQREMLETSIDLLPDLVKLAVKGQHDIAFFSDNKRDNVETTSVVIDGIFTLLTSIKKSKVPPAFTSSVQHFSNFFVASKNTNGSPSEIYQVVRSLFLLSRNSLQRSLSVSLQNPRISTSASADEKFIRVEVSNALGEAVNGIKVYLAKAKASKSSTVLVERQLMDPKENTTTNTVYLFNLFAAKPLPGSYILTIRAVVDNKEYQSTSVDLSVSIVTAISLTGSTLSISDTNSKENPSAKKFDLNYPNNLSVGSVKPNQHLFLSFRVKNEKTQKPFVVSQTVVRIVHEATSREVNYLGLPKGTLYGSHIDLTQNADFWALGGTFQAYLIIGDAHIEKGIYYKAFQFELAADPSKSRKDLWERKSPINHVFRQPEKRPPAIVSLFFTGLVLAPILLIFIGLGVTGFTFGKLPGLGSLYYILFIAGICLIAFVIILYWLALNMFTALYYIAVLLAFTVFVGQRALRSKALASVEKKKVD